MKLSFYPKDANKQRTTIDATVSGCGDRFKVGTRISVLSSEWDKKARVILSPKPTVDSSSIEDRRHHMRVFNRIRPEWDTLVAQFDLDNRRTPSHLEMKQLTRHAINLAHGQVNVSQLDLLGFIQYWIDEVAPQIRITGIQGHQDSRRLKPRTLASYRTTLSQLESFVQDKNVILDFETVDQRFYDQWTSYLEEDLGYAQSSIGKAIKILKKFLAAAEEDIQISSRVRPDYKFKTFAKPKSTSESVALTEEEIQSICDLDLSDDPRLGDSRDRLLIGLFTGLRVSDFNRVNKDHVKGDFFEIDTLKTSHKVAIPIHRKLHEMFNRRAGFPPSIYEQRLNEDFKTICKLANIDEVIPGSKRLAHDDPRNRGVGNRVVRGAYPKYELVSTHTCRRSFATNCYKQGIPLSLIMNITGHRSEAQLRTYLRITEQEYREETLRHFANLNWI